MEPRNQSKQSKTYTPEKKSSSTVFEKSVSDMGDVFHDMPEYYHDMKEKTVEIYEQSKDKVLHFIEERPVTSLCIAGGIGLVLALFLTHSHKKD